VQGDADVVVEGDAVGGIDRADRGAIAHGRVGCGGVAALGPELVEADPADHDHEPAADVVDLIDVGADQPGERFLHGVLGLAQVAEHAVGDVEHVTPLVAPRPAELDIHVTLVGGGLLSFHRLRSSGQCAAVAASPAPEDDAGDGL
jgi:hypothetical protein